MKENDFIAFDNSDRIFINTFLGCYSKCSYCYLPSLNIQTYSHKSVESIIDELNEIPEFIKGKNGTIISIGCYSECWDVFNRKNTINLINLLLEYENPIQLATKQYINIKHIEEIASKIKWKGQITIYTSCSTITDWEKYENKTTNPKKRFQNFLIKKHLDIPVILYIKPVIKGVTIRDISHFINLIEEYKVKVIVGSLFVPNKICSEEKSPISTLLTYKKNSEEDVLKTELKKYADVFEFSTEIVEYYRKENYNG